MKFAANEEIGSARKYLEFVALVLKVNDRSPFGGQDFQVQTIDEARYLFRQAHALNREALKARVIVEVLRAREGIRGAHHWNKLLKQRLQQRVHFDFVPCQLRFGTACCNSAIVASSMRGFVRIGGPGE